MHLLVGSMQSGSMAPFHAASARFLQQSFTVAQLDAIMRRTFQGIQVDANTLANRTPRLVGRPFIPQDGMVRQQGSYDLGNGQQLNFRFAYTREDGVWKVGRFIIEPRR
jgi:hypothetical protein